MLFLRLSKPQIIAFLAVLSVGMLGLFYAQPAGKYALLDSALQPLFKTSATQKSATAKDTELHDTVVCEIDDDPEQINAFGIYHPADLAITLNNLKAQGVKRVLISTHLHWPELESAENNTLATAMRGFQSVVATTPLKRQRDADPIPASFQRASIDASKALGDTELLPQVNSLSLAPTIELPENAYLGFSKLESEKAQSALPLLARWDERIVLSSLVLDLMQQRALTPDQLRISLGSDIQLGEDGPRIPIDSFGYFQPDRNYQPTPAARTLSSAMSGTADISKATQSHAILCATGEKSSQFEAIGYPYQQLSQLAHATSTIAPERMTIWLEIIFLIDCAALAAWLLTFTPKYRTLSYAAALAILLLADFASAKLCGYYSPFSLYLLPLVAGWTLSLVLAKSLHQPQILNHQSQI